MNLRHTSKAWHERRDRPVAPWALGLLFAEPSPGETSVPHHQIRAAARLVNDDPDLATGAHLLLRLRALIEARYLPRRGHRFDFGPIVSYIEPVAADAPYVGVCLSIVGNAEQPWKTLRRGDSDDIPGHCYAVLTDGTFMLIDRAPRGQLSRVTVNATAPMPYQEGSTFRRWLHHGSVAELGGDFDVWDQLYALHQLIGEYALPPVLIPRGHDDHR